MKTTQKLKEIYEANPDDWIVLVEYRNNWIKILNPDFDERNRYQLIHIKYKKVLEAYLVDDMVQIEARETHLQSVWVSLINFIENYNPDFEYRLKNKFRLKSIIYDDYEILDSFQKHGFEIPEWEGEILKEVDGEYFGYVFNIETVRNVAIKWSSLGVVLTSGMNRFKLTPIKREWFEYPENFPALVYDSEDKLALADSNTDGRLYDSYNHLIDMAHGCRLATKDKLLSLYCEED